MTNDEISWSSQLAYDSDTCLSVEVIEVDEIPLVLLSKA